MVTSYDSTKIPGKCKDMKVTISANGSTDGQNFNLGIVQILARIPPRTKYIMIMGIKIRCSGTVLGVQSARDQEGTKIVLEVRNGSRRSNCPHISIRPNDHKRNLLWINSKALIRMSTLAPCHIGIVEKDSATGPSINPPTTGMRG